MTDTGSPSAPTQLFTKSIDFFTKSIDFCHLCKANFKANFAIALGNLWKPDPAFRLGLRLIVSPQA